MRLAAPSLPGSVTAVAQPDERSEATNHQSPGERSEATNHPSNTRTICSTASSFPTTVSCAP